MTNQKMIAASERTRRVSTATKTSFLSCDFADISSSQSSHSTASKTSNQSNCFQKKMDDANESILTQYSHATYRRPVTKDGARLDTTLTSLMSSDSYNTTIDDSEATDECTTSTPDLLDKRKRNVSVIDSDSKNKHGVGYHPTPKSSRKMMRKSKSSKFKVPKPPYSGKSVPYAIELYDWIIRPLPDVKGVCVEGQKKGMTDFWHSSAITDVKKRKYVKTASGTVYKLRGKLNKLCTLETGFTKNIVHAFAHGFPADWKKLLQKFYSSLEHSISIDEECSTIRGYSMKRIERFNKRRLATNRRTIQKKEEVLETLDSILTPVGLVKRCNSADNFTTTRSGRLSLPPLAQWQGQRYIISTNSNTLSVGFQTTMAEKALLKDTSSFMKLRKTLQKPLYHKSFSNSILECPNGTLLKSNSSNNSPIAMAERSSKESPNASPKSNHSKKSTIAKPPAAKPEKTSIVKQGSNHSEKSPVPKPGSNHSKKSPAPKPGSNHSKKLPAPKPGSNHSKKSPAPKPGSNRSTNSPVSKLESIRSKRRPVTKLEDKPSVAQEKKNRSNKAQVHITHAGNLKDNQEEKWAVNNIRALKRSMNITQSPGVVLMDILDDKMFTRSTKKRLENLGKCNVAQNFQNGPSKSTITNNESILSDVTSPTSPSAPDCSMVLRNRTISKADKCKELSEKRELFKVSDMLDKKSGVLSENKAHHISFNGRSMPKKIVKQNKKSIGRKRSGSKSDISVDNPIKNTPKSVSFVTNASKEERRRIPLKRKYCESPVSDDTGYSTEDQSCVKLQDSTPKSCRKEPARKRRKLLSTVQENVERDTWSVEEKDLFERALRLADANSPNFWRQVSDIVPSKTEVECRQYHTSYLEQKTKKVPERKKVTRKSSGRQKGEPVRGGKGTLKRKEDMREFLKEQNENYEDNLFDSSPFLSRKLPMPMITNIDFDKDDSEIFGSNHNFITPMTKNTKIGTPGTRIRAQPVSTRKTPSSQPTNHSINDTPVTVVRQFADKYIHTFMNQHRKNPHNTSTNDSVTPMENTSQSDVSRLPSKSLFSPSVLVYDKERGQDDENEEEEEDNNPFIYYWNEDENE